MCGDETCKPKSKSAAKVMYDNWKPVVEPIKVCAQMIIGFLIFFVLILKVIFYISGIDFSPQLDCSLQLYRSSRLDWLWELFQDIKNRSILNLVAIGLALSAGVELAYMLFTPGPDEAIEPLILGLSSATLLIISKIDGSSWEAALSVAVFSTAIVGLFWARNKLVNDRNDCDGTLARYIGVGSIKRSKHESKGSDKIDI